MAEASGSASTIAGIQLIREYDTAGSLFASKERDAETGLDFFDARYFSSAQGRFTSPDWSTVPQPVPYADLTDPQTLNLYAYVRNNPLSHVDADGHCGFIGDPDCSLKQNLLSLPDRLIGGLKGEANVFLDMSPLTKSVPRFTASNSEQEEVMNAVQTEGREVLQTGLAMALPGPKGLKAEEGAMLKGGARTEPNLPDKTVASGDGVTIEHYTRSGDHGPAHLHVEGEGPSTRIGQNGKPLKGDPELSSTQRGVVQDNKGAIRKAVDQIQRYFKYNEDKKSGSQ